MSRRANETPRLVRAAGAKDSHGYILGSGSGALYIHLHREIGLAHRHYVLRPWQVRIAAFVLARPMLLLYFVAALTWGWMASQAARVPLLQAEVNRLTADAHRLDTLSANLDELQARYEQVQRMLSAATAREAANAVTPQGNRTPPETPRP